MQDDSAVSRCAPGWVAFLELGFVFCSVFFLGTAGCDDAPGQASPTRTSAAGPAASPSPTPTRTVGEISAFAATVADAVANGDVARLVGLATTSPLPCVDEVTDVQSGPVCPADTAPGTIVQAFPFMVCEGGWVVDTAEVFRTMTERAGRLALVAELGTPSVNWPSDVPYGKLVFVFEPRDKSRLIEASGLYVDGERIVRAQRGCRTVAGFIAGEVPRPTVLWSAP